MSPTPAEHVFVIFGGKGDLAERKLLPALADLARRGDLGDRYVILGVGRSEVSDEEYRSFGRAALEGVEHGGLTEHLAYHSTKQGGYEGLRQRIETIEAEAGLPGNRTFYLALPAGAFGPTIEGLGNAGLNEGPGFTRVVIEKPFGHDLPSAIALNATVHRYFTEEQVYRIDHYLGKETVQNLLVFRFGNTIFEDLWNRDRIESVAITVSESLGVEDRAAFYEQTGAIRDILQNHLIQVLALTAMEVPSAFNAEAVRQEKIKVLRSLRPIAPDDVVFGHYTAGEIDGKPVRGYLEEAGVPASSTTETFVAAKLSLESWRWQGVPFYVRTGKRLPQKLTEIAVSFRSPPVCMFESMGSCLLNSNLLTIRLQPREGFSLLIDVKVPGEPLALKRIPLSFRYDDTFGKLPDAYETLILDVLVGDQTLFVHSEEVEASWRLFDPLLSGQEAPLPYAAGTWGPPKANGHMHPGNYS